MRWINPPTPERIEFPIVDAVPEGHRRPFWSVMIPTYNCAEYLRETLVSVLEQDPGPDMMQIEVVDDHSNQDDPASVTEKVGRGRVTFFSQPQNVGIAGNFTTCVTRAKGQWVHILHGDDMVLPGFYDTYRSFIEENPEVTMIFSRAISMDEDSEWHQIMHSPPDMKASGIIENAAPSLARGDFIVPSSVIVPRRVYEKVGGFAPSLSHCADWEMWMRVAASGPVEYLHRPYLLYRIHSDSDTSKLAVSAQNIAEVIRTVEIGIQRLPDQLQEGIRDAAYRDYSEYANMFRTKFHVKRQHEAALRHAWWAWKLYPSIGNMVNVLKSITLNLVGAGKRSSKPLARFLDQS